MSNEVQDPGMAVGGISGANAGVRTPATHAVGKAPTIGHKLVAMFAPGKSLLVISGTLEPPSEASHEQLAALLDKDNPPEVTVEYANVNDVLSVQVTFEHKTRNVAHHAAGELKLRHEARDQRVPVAELKRRKAEAATIAGGEGGKIPAAKRAAREKKKAAK